MPRTYDPDRMPHPRPHVRRAPRPRPRRLWRTAGLQSSGSAGPSDLEHIASENGDYPAPF